MALRSISRIEGYTFPEGAWDVRGWRVRTGEDRHKVGKVDDMLVDESGTPRYLDVDLGLRRKHVLLPLEYARADAAEKVVWVDRMTRERFREVPPFALEPEVLNEDFERRLDAVYGGAAARKEPELPPISGGGTLELRRLGDKDEYQTTGDDPRGWKVLTADGTEVGKVSGLLIDPSLMQGRFLDVTLDEKTLGLERVDRHILIPVNRTRLSSRRKRVVVGGLFVVDMADYPQYTGLPVSRAAERDIEMLFAHAGTEELLTPETAPEPTTQPDWRITTLRRFYGPAPRPRTRVEEED